MNISLLRNFALTVLFAGAMQAATITWDFSTGTVGDVGSSTESFTSGGFAVGATGYSNTTTFNNLFGKNDAGDEKGLGLNGFSDNEIAGNGFIQLDLSNLAGFTNFKISFGSSTDGEAWQVLECGTAGTVCGNSILTGTDEGTLDSITVSNVTTTGRYLDIRATTGNMLVYQLQATTSAVPEPSTGMLLLLSGMLVAGVRVLKFKR